MTQKRKVKQSRRGYKPATSSIGRIMWAKAINGDIEANKFVESFYKHKRNEGYVNG